MTPRIKCFHFFISSIIIFDVLLFVYILYYFKEQEKEKRTYEISFDLSNNTHTRPWLQLIQYCTQKFQITRIRPLSMSHDLFELNLSKYSTVIVSNIPSIHMPSSSDHYSTHDVSKLMNCLTLLVFKNPDCEICCNH